MQSITVLLTFFNALILSSCLANADIDTSLLKGMEARAIHWLLG
jgi:uridylate kinase